MTTGKESQQNNIRGDIIEADIKDVSGGQVAVGKDITQIQAGRDVYSAETINIIYQSAEVDPTTVHEELSSEVCVHLLERFINQLDHKELPLETRVFVVDEGLQVVYHQGEKLNSPEIRSSKIKRLKDQIQADLEGYRQSKQDCELNPRDQFAKADVADRSGILRRHTEQARILLQTALTLFHQDVETPMGTSDEALMLQKKTLPKYPYKFLDSFEEKDAGIFFGRKLETRDLRSHVLAHRLTVLYAKSGTGKTSLLHAGIVPRLGQEGYLTVSVRIFRDPLTEVKQAINDCLAQPLQISQETDLHDFLALVAEQEQRPLALILDQFEEFFIRLSSSLRESFIAQLARLHYAINLPVTLIISIREDFLGELSEVEVYIPPIFNNRFRLQPLTEKQAKEAIAEPVKLYGVSYEEGLLEQMLSDLAREGVEPPQLQIVCDKLWNKLGSGETVITHEMYQRAGGTRQILAGYVTEVLVEFDEERRKAARAILKEMVTSQQTGTPLELHKFQEKFAATFSPEIVGQALQRLINRRLIRSIERDDTLYYELAHEYLIEKIRDWFDEEEVELKKAQEMLERALADYEYSKSLMPRSHLKIVERYRDKLTWSSPAEELLRQSKKRSKRISLSVTVLAVILFSLTSFAAYKQYLENQENFRRRYDIGSFPEVANLDQAALILYRIEKDGQPEQVEKFDGKKIDLRAGDYYLQAKKEQWLLTYPVYAGGYNTVAKPVEVNMPEGLSRPDDMGYIPAGWFRMGDKENTGYPDEKPAHDVYVNAFFMDKQEVTNREYAKFMEAGGYQKETFWTEDGWFWNNFLKVSQPEYWDDEEFNASDDPVVGVTWYEAYAYCQWAGKQLPTEAEWEKAARGPEGYRYAYGNVYDPSKIDTKELNGYGLYNMTGGVWEWVSDRYGEDYYRSSPDKNPEGPEQGELRILRGGSSYAGENFVRTSYRGWHFTPDYQQKTAGFRCMRRINNPNGSK